MCGEISAAALQQAGILSRSQMFNLVHRGAYSFKAEDDLDSINWILPLKSPPVTAGAVITLTAPCF